MEECNRKWISFCQTLKSIYEKPCVGLLTFEECMNIWSTSSLVFLPTTCFLLNDYLAILIVSSFLFPCNLRGFFYRSPVRDFITSHDDYYHILLGLAMHNKFRLHIVSFLKHVDSPPPLLQNLYDRVERRM